MSELSRMKHFFSLSGLLNRPQENAVMTCLDTLQSLLAVATKKRPLNPPNLVANKLGGGGTTFEPIDEKTRLKKVPIHGNKI